MVVCSPFNIDMYHSKEMVGTPLNVVKVVFYLFEVLIRPYIIISSLLFELL